MAQLKLLPLEDALSSALIDKLRTHLKEQGVDELPEGDEAIEIEDALTDDQLTDFMDRLEAHDIGCDVYLPVEFEERIETKERSFGSLHMLAEALDEIREELDIDEDDVDLDDEDADLDSGDELMLEAWRVFSKACQTAIDKHMPLHIVS